MITLLVNDQGQTMARLKNVEKFDGSQTGHVAGLLDLRESLSASSNPAGGVDEATASLLGSPR